MHAFATALLLSLPLSALAGLPHQGSLHRRHYDHARNLTRRASSYKLVDDYNNSTFFDKFDFYTGSDPTHGLVDFVSKQEAMSSGLAYVQNDGTIVLGVDDTTQLAANQARKSVRISSKTQYNSGTLFITDMYSMPHGCATWPAYWTVGDNWPNNGELDILEGVNEQTANQITAHTGTVCNLASNLQTAARVVGTTCQSANGANAGCAFVLDDTSSYGHGFNQQAGGVYAHTWESDAIKVWYFARNAIPQDITDGNPNPDSWGTPTALFSNNANCNIASSFKDHSIVFDITLCGDWAGAAYSGSGCPGTCAQQVANPDNFKVAKFNLASVKVYSQQ